MKRMATLFLLLLTASPLQAATWRLDVRHYRHSGAKRARRRAAQSSPALGAGSMDEAGFAGAEAAATRARELISWFQFCSGRLRGRGWLGTIAPPRRARGWIAKRAFARVTTPAEPAASAATLTLAEYQQALTRIRSFLETGNADAARAEGQALAGNEVDSPNGRFLTDSTLLAEIHTAKPRDLAVESRIDATLASLRRVAPANPTAIDPALMQRLQREQSVEELRRGGDIRGVKVETPILTRIGQAIVNAGQWIGEEIGKFFDWLSRFWPDDETKRPKKPKATPGMRWTIGTLVALIILLLGILAFEVIRRGRKAASPLIGESAPLGSSRDDDPLSRGSNEWERYAAQLAAEGRTREAIRAWYNAVLVTLYGASVLQFRKGRTNWEYVAALRPEIAWRPRFIQLTRRFEEEWYGSDQSSIDALDECSIAARHILEAVRRTRREAA